MSKRRHARFVRRLETEFAADGKNYRGISSDLSCGGLFIRTNHAFAPGTFLDITIHLPDGGSAKMRGRVRRAMKTPVVSLKNGMGVELIERDMLYTSFMRTFTGECDEESIGPEISNAGASANSPAPEPPDFLIVTCSGCNVKNKVMRSKMALAPKCGRCGSPLAPES